MSSEATGADAAGQNCVEHAVRMVTSAAKSMGPKFSSPQAETSSSSFHVSVHSIINSVVEKHSAIWAEELSSFVSSVKLIHQTRVSLMADDIRDNVSSLMRNRQTDVDASSSQYRDELHPVVTSEYQASVDVVRDGQQNPPVASEGQVPEASLHSKDAQESQVNENVATDCLVSHAGQQHPQHKGRRRQETTAASQDDLVHVSPDHTEDQSPNFSRGICAIASDDPSPHGGNVASTSTPADASLIGGLRTRNNLTIALCRPSSSNPILKRQRSSVLADISMVYLSEARDLLSNPHR